VTLRKLYSILFIVLHNYPKRPFSMIKLETVHAPNFFRWNYCEDDEVFGSRRALMLRLSFLLSSTAY
jgi:hypothetical protein